jgi:hypothetical protein
MAQFGHRWAIGQHIKDMTPVEIKKAQDDYLAKQPHTR